MTVKELSQYSDLVEQKKFIVCSVKNGVISSERKKELRQINRKIGAITDFILKCPNHFIRDLMIKRFIQGYHYEKIAALIGDANTAERCETMIKDYIRHQQ